MAVEPADSGDGAAFDLDDGSLALLLGLVPIVAGVGSVAAGGLLLPRFAVGQAVVEALNACGADASALPVLAAEPGVAKDAEPRA